MPTAPNPLRLDPALAFRNDSARASAHSDLMADPRFHAAANAAMLAYQFSLANAAANEAVTVAFKLRGAKEFLDVLMTLGEKPTPHARADDPALLPPERDPRELWRTPTAHP